MAWLPLARLLRLPNVFTSFADIALGLAVTLTLVPADTMDGLAWRMMLLFTASGLLYSSGMVWNDIFDYAEDRRDRPFRPLPSGQIRRSTAVILASVLMILGVITAALTGLSDEMYHPAPLGFALGLVVAILLYDGWLKHTPIGPISMGLCRFLNVLLGVSLIDPALLPWPIRLNLAAVIGVYIVGVTWFARTEATISRRGELRAAVGVMVLAGVLALVLPLHFEPGTLSRWFPYLLAIFAVAIGGPIARALRKLEPKPVQMAVKRCILGLVLLDAVLATLFVGLPGLLVLFLLPPALLLGKWVYST